MQEVGVPLLVRDTRRVALTSAGREYLDQSREILRGVSHAAESARRVGPIERGVLLHRGARHPAAGAARVQTTLSAGIALDLRELPSKTQVAEVLKGTIDIGIVHEPSTVKAVSVETVRREALVAVLPANHALARKPSLRLLDLHAERFIMFPRGDGAPLHDRIIAACTAAGFSPNIAARAKMIVTMIGLVAAGMGIAILTAVCAKIRHPHVVFRKLSPGIEIQSGVIWNGHTAHLNPSTRAFIDVCRMSLGRGTSAGAAAALRRVRFAHPTTLDRGRPRQNLYATPAAR